ncbi:MAG: autotransporter-associated beta strand repeat-containing protein [Thermoguttaceae bacterium]
MRRADRFAQFIFSRCLTSDDATALAGSDVALGSGATLDLGGNSVTLGSATLLDGSITDGSVTASAYMVANGMIGANLAGTTGLTMTGGGTVTLSGSNTYTGGTLLDDSAGTLIIGEGDSLPQGAMGSDGVTPAGTALEIDAGGVVLNSPLMDASGLGYTSGSEGDSPSFVGRNLGRSRGLDMQPQGDTLSVMEISTEQPTR